MLPSSVPELLAFAPPHTRFSLGLLCTWQLLLSTQSGRERGARELDKAQVWQFSVHLPPTTQTPCYTVGEVIRKWECKESGLLQSLWRPLLPAGMLRLAVKNRTLRILSLSCIGNSAHHLPVTHHTQPLFSPSLFCNLQPPGPHCSPGLSPCYSFTYPAMIFIVWLHPLLFMLSTMFSPFSSPLQCLLAHVPR